MISTNKSDCTKELTEIKRERIEEEKKINIKQEVKDNKSIAQYVINDLQQTRDQYQQQLQQQQQLIQELKNEKQKCQEMIYTRGQQLMESQHQLQQYQETVHINNWNSFTLNKTSLVGY